jgi:Protein of unknown function (DUF3224)
VQLRVSLALATVFISGSLCCATGLAQKKEAVVTQHAHGTFTVEIKPLDAPPAEGLGRMSIDKKISGDLVGTSKGEMFTGGDPQRGIAGYVAMEVITGTLAGRHGTFALQHSATMTPEGRELSVIVVPGSGTGELKGIRGDFKIDISGGKHSYDFDYSLP